MKRKFNVVLKFASVSPEILVTLFCLQFFRAHGLDLTQCRNSLGMQSGSIPDEAITASSSFNDDSVGPKNGRIRTETNGGAWCPKSVIERDTYEYLQIDLGRLTVITMVEIQGRFGNGQGQEFTEEFLLEYQREDGGEWMRFRNKRGEERFEGNGNTYSAELRQVSPPIIGKRIRFIPYCRNPRTVCLRVELYGCTWEDGIVSYSMRQGDKRGAEVDFFDFTYDGIISQNYLHDGLGQLTDGEEGDTNFRLDPQNLGIKGYEWVGWKNDTLIDPGPVEILFKFNTVRNFSSVMLFCNNYFTKDNRVFKTAVIHYSIGGKYFKQKKDKFYFIRDTVVEYARNVYIKLDHINARYIKLELYFDAKWILISEVQFESKPAFGNFTNELPPPTTVSTTTVKQAGKNKGQEMVADPNSSGPTIDLGSDHNHDDYVPVDVGRKHNENDIHKTEEKKSFEEQYIGIIIGALAFLIVVLFVIVLFIIIRHKKRKHNNNRLGMKPVVDHVTMNMNHVNTFHPTLTGKMSNGTMYKGLPVDDMDEHHICNDSRDYAVPDVTKSALKVALPPIYPPQPPVRVQPLNQLDLPPPTYDALYAAADIVNSQGLNIPNLQGATGSSVYSIPNAELLLSIDLSIVEFPRENLRFVEVLGEGQFGEVHLCEAVDIADYLQDDYIMNRNVNRPVLVAVKMLRKDADDRARSDFQKEIKIMSQLKDPNIVRVLGVCIREEPLCMIVEYMKYGDLNQFLLDHVPESPMAEAANAKTLSYGCLIYMASQIASGMKYLESLNMVHRDLATRNCLVGTNFTIKISDFGMSRSLYSADYYRIEGRAVLPIRWMAWESILLGKFTTKSDVWSLGVTLWEVLTFARDQPYDTMNDEQVIENAGHYYRNDNKQIYLPQPGNCPKEIFDLMLECWNRAESERPSFREIQMFLQRKNMGYNPKDEKMNQIKVPIC
ncbi:discoidin domain-containing receptor 2-like isoform X2 [Ruditapes philippinarum]|uniref:discoidin domain-containing receptor 2-like isoform X2 n=1 Tax=Ruditapes philippinarum TaxID=129788 RepID=UPI00295A7FE3|nr:discoidin domain-containing receptor 2-like isoform X2 [Ruditapes philippinarum]